MCECIKNRMGRFAIYDKSDYLLQCKKSDLSANLIIRPLSGPVNRHIQTRPAGLLFGHLAFLTDIFVFRRASKFPAQTLKSGLLLHQFQSSPR